MTKEKQIMINELEAVIKILENNPQKDGVELAIKSLAYITVERSLEIGLTKNDLKKLLEKAENGGK